MQPEQRRIEAGHALVWSYRPRPDREAEFVTEYGSSGSWTRLFARSPDYLGTQLLLPNDRDGAYLVIDYWRTAEGHSSFLAQLGAEYAALSQRLSELWIEEVSLGSFQWLA
jgi:hypothetical protein